MVASASAVLVGIYSLQYVDTLNSFEGEEDHYNELNHRI